MIHDNKRYHLVYSTKWEEREKPEKQKPNFITLEKVVKDFLRDEQGQKAFDKINHK